MSRLKECINLQHHQEHRKLRRPEKSGQALCIHVLQRIHVIYLNQYTVNSE